MKRRLRVRWHWLLLAVASLLVGFVLLAATSTKSCAATGSGAVFDCGVRTPWDTAREILVISLSVGAFAYSIYRALRRYRTPVTPRTSR